MAELSGEARSGRLMTAEPEPEPEVREATGPEPKVRRLDTSRSSSVSSADAGSMLRLYRDSFRHIKNVSETGVSRLSRYNQKQ